MAKEIKVTFTDHTGEVPKEYYPVPAKKVIPDWYKDMNSYVRGKKEVVTDPADGDTSSTIKKCMPVFDALTAGYIIPTACDIYVYQEDGAPRFKWPSQKYLGSHSAEQIGNHPDATGFRAAKFVNTWIVKTPPGYSCMFIPPMHHDNMFKILEGVVDTDTYHAAVEFPFQLKNISWEGVIPAGTPMVQVIPFKRESWSHEVINTPEEAVSHYIAQKRLRSVFFEAYKNKFWHKKDFN
jgi:hypothetical protein